MQHDLRFSIASCLIANNSLDMFATQDSMIQSFSISALLLRAVGSSAVHSRDPFKKAFKAGNCCNLLKVF